MNLDTYETIILDCDGVILDSNYLKLDAFRDALSEFDGLVVEKFIDYFKNNFGTSRYHLIKVFIVDFLKQEFDADLYHKIINKYSRHCVVLYQKANLTKDFLKFIERYKNKNIFVASGSAQEELREVFRNRDMDKYFIDVFGSPTKKTEIVKNIITTYKNAVMIGDSKSDMLAAKESNVDFIFMKKYCTNENMNKIKDLWCINSLGDLI